MSVSLTKDSKTVAALAAYAPSTYHLTAFCAVLLKHLWLLIYYIKWNVVEDIIFSIWWIEIKQGSEICDHTLTLPYRQSKFTWNTKIWKILHEFGLSVEKTERGRNWDILTVLQRIAIIWDRSSCSPMWTDVSEEHRTSIFNYENQPTRKSTGNRWAGRCSMYIWNVYHCTVALHITVKAQEWKINGSVKVIWWRFHDQHAEWCSLRAPTVARHIIKALFNFSPHALKHLVSNCKPTQQLSTNGNQWWQT
jgi:hypothetical protein